MNTKERAVHTLLTRLRGPVGADPLRRRPWKAWRQVPVLLPGEKTSTRLEPAKGIYDRVADVADLDGVVDAAVWVGYAWADEPRCQAAVVVMIGSRWNVDVPRDISVMFMYMTCEVAVVVHGTVQNDRRFRQHAGQGGGL